MFHNALITTCNKVSLRRKNLKTKKLVIAVLSFLLLSGILITAVTAKTWPSLPNKAVTLEITNLTPWTFPFVIALSGVPGGFDVSDGLYTGWCVDVTHFIERGVEYQVNLYSSLSPPAEVSSVQWDMINYILNHKDAGTGDDIQDALWYFINGGAYFTSWGKPHTTSATTEAIVADAIANGAGYTPGTGDTVAIICLPTGTPEERAQMLVIELTIPPLEPGLTPGFWKHNIGVYLGENPGKYSAFPDGTKLNATLLEGYATTVGVTLQDAYDALSARGPGMDTVRADMANAFNAAAGYGPFVD
jgi:hypothetical protein